MNRLFFDLIQVCIGNREYLSHTPSAEEWVTIYMIAKKQALLGVCFYGIQKLPKEMLVNISPKLKLQWFALVVKIQQRNEVLNQRCIETQQLLAKEDMRSSVLKGQGIACQYPEQMRMLRQSGDIDVWVSCGMKKTMNYACERFGEVEYDYINAHLPMFKEVEVEVHWRVQSMTNLLRNRRLQRWLEREETKEMLLGGRAVLPNGDEITVPTMEFNMFYLMLHCYHHAFESGLGLRQLMDYYFLLINGNANGNINRLFREFGMERLVGAVMWIMQEVFGLEREGLLCEPDEKEGRYILSEVMAGGNVGHHDERIRKVGKGKWQSVLASLQHALHVLRRYPSEALWTPVWMAYHFVWKRTLKIR